MSDERAFKEFQSGDVVNAASLLTILPIPVDHKVAGARAAQSVWAYPLVGAGLGAMAAILANIAGYLGASNGIAAGLALAVLAVSTGAMHEDGLADCADGLGGGRDKDRRLQIMKDSRIGAFGAVALGIALLMRWSTLEGLSMAGNLFWPLIAVGAISRLPMVLVMFFMAPARRDGLAADVGLPPPNTIAAAAGIAVLIGFICLGWGVLPMMFWALIAPVPLLLAAQKLIGGQTGDVLGGTQQLAEIAGLSVALALIS